MIRTVLAAIAILVTASAADAASLLPPGKNCFYDSNGDPLAAGTVDFYIPGSTVPKSTWRNDGETVLNTNPVVLDSAGCAVIYGSGVYRQIVKDVLGNSVWDQQVADPGVNGVSWGGPASGSGNNQVITAEGFALIDGQMVSYLATQNNTGAMTLDAGPSVPALPLIKDSINGPVPMVGGEVRAGNVVSAIYVEADASFHMVAPPFPTSGSTANVIGPPGGRLTLDVNNPVMANNVLSVGTIYYSPFIGAQIPIWNGAVFAPYTFSQLAANINPTDHLANAIYDLFVIEDVTTERLCTGPAWSTATSRSLAIGYLAGIQVNVAAMACRWGPGAAWKSVPQYQATYVGTVRIDSTPGVTSWRPDPTPAPVGSPPPPNGGPSTSEAELFLWNNYNRVAVKSVVFDTTISYTYNNVNVRSANASILNRIEYVTGGLTDIVIVTYKHRASTPATLNSSCSWGVALNGTSNYYNNIFAQVVAETATVTTGTDSVTNIMPASNGFAYIQATESTVGNCTYLPNGVIQAVFRM